jgi:acetamidase/formamidase
MKPLRRWLALSVFMLASTAIECQTPQTHRFIPRTFYNTFSGSHPPALRIKPGDRVMTKTIDASGTDWDGKSVASGPNPQTGPFFVEGAEPGDVLVVMFEKMEPNRPTAYSASLLAPYTVDPQTLIARQDREPRRVTWTIDKAKGVARLDAAEIKPAMELPLKPMLGCVAVAPARKEAIATSTPGSFGGNMDYAGMTAGVKVMFAVSEFTVDLIKKKAIGWPRLETDTHIMVLGSARPLLEAFQHATSELQKWLITDYGFSERGADTFMGQALEYDIANVVDPSFTIVAKIRKTLLPRR